jgi:hypothetical protein
VALALLLAGSWAAAAQSRIPANELPGRERERFMQGPADPSMRGVPPPVVQIEPPARQPRSHKPRHRKRH